MRAFPYGPAPFAILCLALLSGLVLATQQPPKKSATLTYWTFARPHYEAYQKALPKFLKEHPIEGVTPRFAGGIIGTTAAANQETEVSDFKMTLAIIVAVGAIGCGSAPTSPNGSLGHTPRWARSSMPRVMSVLVPSGAMSHSLTERWPTGAEERTLSATSLLPSIIDSSVCIQS